MSEQNNAPVDVGRTSLNPHCWVENYADDLFRFALARLGDTELARDLVQETFLSALESVPQFKNLSSERTWLTAILKHKLVDNYRRKLSQMTPNVVYPDEEADLAFFNAEDGHWREFHSPRVFGIEDYTPGMDLEFNHVLEACMQKLPSQWMTVFTMKHIDGEPTKDICAALKITSANFWVIMHRAKVNLRACLQKNWN